MPQITAHINKKHKSLLDHDSDIDTPRMKKMDRIMKKRTMTAKLSNFTTTMNSETYKEAQFLRFVTIAELKEMGFQLGGIAAIRGAIERWSVPRV